ncbi:hypothetical protein H0H81_010571, partial [Sphagnurus paluster]
VTYTLERKSTWKIKIDSTATKETPIMMSGHHYWNLEAYQETEDLIGHYAQLYASKFVATDKQLLPNGTLTDVSSTPMDFRKPKSVGRGIETTKPGEFCGDGE